MFELNEFTELHDYSAEMAVIGGILMKNSKAIEVMELITAIDFYNINNQKIFRAMELCYEAESPIDPITVSSKLEEIRELQNIGGLKYLAETAQNTPSAANVMAYAQIVADKSKSRQIDAQALEIRNSIYSEDGSTQDKINNALSIASNIGDFEDGSKERSFREIQKALYDQVQERVNNKGGLTGESMGFDLLDRRFNGFNPTDLIIVAGRPAMGKTTFALNMAQKVARNKPVVVFSMEMSGEQLAEKMWSSEGGCPMNSIKRGKFEGDHHQLFSHGVTKTRELKFDIDDRGGLTPQQVRAKCLRLKKKHGELGLVMIDYLQLMTVNKAQGQTDKVTQISLALKSLAKELRCPVVALSQLNRGVESRPNKRPVMSDLRDSGAIEQDADIILFCYRDDYYAEKEGRDSEAPNIAEIITAKFRGGETGTDHLRTELHLSRFTDILGGYNPPPPIDNKTKSTGTRTQF